MLLEINSKDIIRKVGNKNTIIIIFKLHEVEVIFSYNIVQQILDFNN